MDSISHVVPSVHQDVHHYGAAKEECEGQNIGNYEYEVFTAVRIQV
jgi:hypothetical protein